MKCPLCLFALIGFAGAAATSARASEWGCEVLLCAASSNPSWRGVASCHPPMQKLLSAMKKPGFSWPTCPEGGAGAPGFEQYAECPAGWSPTEDNDQLSHRTQGQSLCMRTVNDCGARQSFFRSSNGGRLETTKDDVTRIFSGTSSCSFTEYKARPLRAEPYYFDIEDRQTNKSSRFWFNLNR